MSDPKWTEFEEGERCALLQLRSFITEQSFRLKGRRLIDEIDSYCATRLHDLRMDALHRERMIDPVAARR